MPAGPRSEIVDPDVVAIYHCWARCVRRAWLCGVDPLTGVDYEYRRQWIERREILLARLFAIEIGWHAELSNHLFTWFCATGPTSSRRGRTRRSPAAC